MTTLQPSWRRSLAEAGAVLYLPHLLPFVFGPLTECRHCTGLYLRLFPLVPGHVVGIAGVQLLGKRGSAVFYLLWGLGAFLLLALTSWGMYRLGRRRWWLGVPVALLAGAHALGLSHLLRA